MADKKGNSYIMYEYFITTINRFEPEVQLAMFHAIANYGLYGEEPDFSMFSEITEFSLNCAFDGIKANISSNKAKRQKNHDDGELGGNKNFAKGKPNPYYRKNVSQEMFHEKDNLNVNGNVNVNLNENVNVNGNGNVNGNKADGVSDGSPLNAEPPSTQTTKKRYNAIGKELDEFGMVKQP